MVPESGFRPEQLPLSPLNEYRSEPVGAQLSIDLITSRER